MSYSEEDLQVKINSFMQRKNVQFPELTDSFKSTEPTVDGSRRSRSSFAYSW